MPRKKQNKDKTEKAQGAQGLKADSIADLRPVPQENVFRKISLKLVFALILVAALGVLFIKNSAKTPSQLKIYSQNDKFKVEFQLTQKDQKNASEFLEKIQASQEVLKGINFALDSTSSAKLAWASPIIIDLSFGKNTINLKGESKTPLSEADLTAPAFRLPKDTSLAVYGTSLTRQALEKLVLPQYLADWTSANLQTDQGEYLVVNGPQDDFTTSIATKNQPDFESLSKFDLDQTDESSYIEETSDDVTIHLVRYDLKNEKTLAIFALNDRVYTTSSLDNAKNMIKIQKGEDEHMVFPKTDSNVSLAIYAKQNEQTGDESYMQLTNQSPALQKYLKGTKDVFLAISGREIYGYINY